MAISLRKRIKLLAGISYSTVLVKPEVKEDE
jgi:hypothetical protein